MTTKQYMQEFDKDQPKAVGISVYTSPIYREAISLAKQLKGKTRLIAGGYHASTLPQSLTSMFDAVVVGEGENSILEALTTNGIIANVPPNLDKIPNPDRSLLDMSKYGVNQDGKRTATLITSRGCPFGCAFCGNLEKKVRYTPIDKVIEQIKEVEKEGFEAIYFVDDLFTLDKKRMYEIVRNTSIPYRITTRAKLFDEETAKILGKNGCEWVSFGIESGSDEILKRVNKQETTVDMAKAITLAKKYNIKSKGFFIIGLPGETEKTAKKTIDFSLQLKHLGLNQADFYYLVPFPGSPIWERPSEFGIKIKDRNFQNYLQIGPKAKCVIETEELSSERIEELTKEAREIWKN